MFARYIVASSVNCILIAHYEEAFAELAQQIRVESGVECIYASVDLSLPDVFDKIIVVGDHEIGLFIKNADADPNGPQFLNVDVET